MKDLYLLITIVRRKDDEEYTRFYCDRGVNVLYNTICNGTAHAKTLNLLGIDRTEKTMLLGLVTKRTLDGLKRGLSYEMKIDLPDRGVAMAIPLSSVGGAKTLEYFTSGQEVLPEFRTEDDEMEVTQELIVAIYQRGYTDMVMDAAREAGAKGGTTINAKGTASKKTTFFGISLAEEKEMALIVSTKEQKKEIMRSIMQNAGAESKAHAVVFSLPVTDTAGFRFADTVEKD